MSLFWTIREKNHLYLFYKGKLIYKRWVAKDGVSKTESSMIFNEVWQSEKITVRRP